MECLGLSLGDNGQGFKSPDQPDALARRDHFELMGVQRRALLHGGQMSTHSAPGDGVEIAVQMPYAFPH